MKDDNFLICPICENRYRKIDNQHLRKHGLSLDQYKDQYGDDAPFGYCKTLKDSRSAANHPLFGVGHSEKTKQKLSESVKQMWQTWEPTEKQKQHAREMSYKEDGTHVNLGRKHSDETIVKMQEKARITSLERYGYPTAMLSKIVQEKRKQTNLKRYGVEAVIQVPDFFEKRRLTLLQRYGIENISQVPEIQVKVQASIKKTCQQRYGTDHPMQDKAVFTKVLNSTYRKKEYIFPSGKIVQVQGYEPQAIDWLLANGLSEDEIDVENVPRFWYELNDKQKAYFPDIYVPDLNLVLEVKSTWTLESDLKINRLKQEAVISEGFEFYIILVSDTINLLKL